MNERPHRQGRDEGRSHRGVILLVTLVILVILSMLGYTLCIQVAARRHRDQFLIDHSIARHACASGLKYALASVGGLQFDLVSRPDEPDFSDVFALSEPEYQTLLDEVAAKLAADANLAAEGLGWMPAAGDSGKDAKKKAAQQSRKGTAGMGDMGDFDDGNDFDPNGALAIDAALLTIRGPYGPPWPLVTAPLEFEIGSARVKIEIEDENAKYPLGWAMIADTKLQAQAVAGWATFCEWMGYTPEEIGALNEGVAKIRGTKPFKTEFVPEAQDVEPPASLKNKITRPTPGTPSTVARRMVTRRPVAVEEQIERQNKEYARLLHSSLIDRDLLARPSIASDTRQESALKYLGLWASRHVNVNTAPRQVLEAALTFGSLAEAPKMAEAIIQHRRTKPVADVNELRQALPRYSSAIEDCRVFITAKSTVFTIRVTAISGVAKATAVVAVSREGDQVQQIAAVSD